MAQSLSGVVRDAETGDPIAFASIALTQIGKGTVSDIDGRFDLIVPRGYDGNITIQHVSYHEKIMTIDLVSRRPVIFMKKNVRELEDFVFEKENPANAIVRKVIRHRKKHDPNHLDSYSFRSYTKEIYKLTGNSEEADSLNQLIVSMDSLTLSRRDSSVLSLDSLVRKQHFFMSESVAEVKYLTPGMTNEKVIATDISGFENGVLAATGSQYQAFGFYNETFKVFETEYINPINPSGLKQYNFYLEDTTFFDSDTVYVLSFEPKKGRKFEGLKGLLSVHAQDYALTNVIAESYDETSKINFKIQQLYDIILGQWFPVQLNADILFKDYGIYGRNLVLTNKRYLSNIEINPKLAARDFSDVSLDILNVSESESGGVLDTMRVAPRDSVEIRTYQTLDSLTANLQVIEDVIQVAFTLKLPIGKLDLGISELFVFNKYEKFRTGLDLQTNDQFSRKVRLGGYGAYGFGDQEWKYGANIKFHLNRRTDTYFLLNYKNDIHEAGRITFFEEAKVGFNEFVRAWQGALFDRQELYQVTFNHRLAPFLYGQLNASRSAESTTYDYNFQSSDYTGNVFDLNELSFSLRFVKGEEYYNIFGKRILKGYDFPVIQVRYGHGHAGWLSGDFTFNRIDFSLEYANKHRWGKSTIFIKAGLIDGEVPFGHLITGWGNKSASFTVPNHFQTMGVYEFASDQALGVFFNHNFGNVLVRSKLMKPELVIYQSYGVGELDNIGNHQEIIFSTMEKGYLESGIGVKNLIRMNYLNVGYFGFGGDVFYRYGPYGFAKTSDNLAFVINMGFSF